MANRRLSTHDSLSGRAAKLINSSALYTLKVTHKKDPFGGA